jgi:outer membrane protein assembly factor BamB
MEHHPYAFDDGSLVFHGMDSPLVKIDACARPVWTVDGEFHHSIERDAGGDFWTVETIRPPSIPFVDRDFDDDAIAKVSADGKVLFRKSAAQILIDSNLQHVVYSHDEYDRDPIHLNDVQPVPADGPYWKAGDLFLSFRNPSMVALYRPSTNVILWSKQGPWLMQHDIDIINDHEIAVFNNNTVAAPSGGRTIGSNNIVIYDFATDKTREPFAVGFKKLHIHTETNGLFRFLPDGSVMVEEHDYGRLLAMDADGDVRWSFANRATKDGRVYHLGWSRAMTGERAAALKSSLANVNCSGA